MAKKEKKVNSKSSAAARKFEAELPEIAKKYNLRVSSPYGYYPEDVEKALFNLENANVTLARDNDMLRVQNDEQKAQLDSCKAQILNLQLQMENIEIRADTSAEEDFVNLSQISRITDKPQPQTMNKINTKIVMPVSVVDDTHSQEKKNTKLAYKDLVKPKKTT